MTHQVVPNIAASMPCPLTGLPFALRFYLTMVAETKGVLAAGYTGIHGQGYAAAFLKLIGATAQEVQDFFASQPSYLAYAQWLRQRLQAGSVSKLAIRKFGILVRTYQHRGSALEEALADAGMTAESAGTATADILNSLGDMRTRFSLGQGGAPIAVYGIPLTPANKRCPFTGLLVAERFYEVARLESEGYLAEGYTGVHGKGFAAVFLAAINRTADEADEFFADAPSYDAYANWAAEKPPTRSARITLELVVATYDHTGEALTNALAAAGMTAEELGSESAEDVNLMEDVATWTAAVRAITLPAAE
ncbi:MAG: hypothetical protein AAB391_03545 [Patescibacteria group bacterium]